MNRVRIVRSGAYVYIILAAWHCGASELCVGNLLANGDFTTWSTRVEGGVTTTSVGTPPNSLPDGWYGGPGVGATATYYVIAEPDTADDTPPSYMRVAWSAPQSPEWPGEEQHRPATRFTFLEYFGLQDVRMLAGKTAVVSFWARVGTGTLDIVPILWHSYDAATPGIVGIKGKGYELFEAGAPGEVAVAQGAAQSSAVCRLTTTWTHFERRITLPTVEGRSITPGHYTGVGFDLLECGAPTVDLADVCVRDAASLTPKASD